ncbi:MAG: hypothetical protein JWR61_5322 [Ferruginibacter sp.]|uniref:alpha-1,2-fucosyltransferase n=1 Tax=Ferruginibacter sp. TaxID=1940288 RepID=UPI00265AF3C7|nr:alpha-1,2-fucosyltransferase [Ferruginibacter sp.]MDB5280367.1 hypothetical protein [Ferruginibacter sp.]
MSIVVCKLPKAGLGNQLFPLMKAYTFAHLNGLPVIVTNYHQLKIGPYLRNEKVKRNYSGFFTFQKNIFAAQFDKWKLKKYKNNQQIEPSVEKIDGAANAGIYVFSEMPHWDHYFDGLKENRQLVVALFKKLVSQKVYGKIKNHAAPCIGIHIRMGDFRKLKEGEDFNKVGIVRTPESHFIQIIKTIRNIHGSALPVSVFTDGFAHEFKELFKLQNISLIEGNSDIADLILLSKSKLIVTSATSTFSYWACFLSQAIIIKHPAHVNTIIRSKSNNAMLFEGALDIQDQLLVEQIRNII